MISKARFFLFLFSFFFFYLRNFILVCWFQPFSTNKLFISLKNNSFLEPLLHLLRMCSLNYKILILPVAQLFCVHQKTPRTFVCFFGLVRSDFSQLRYHPRSANNFETRLSVTGEPFQITRKSSAYKMRSQRMEFLSNVFHWHVDFPFMCPLLLCDYLFLLL